jgi:hypothetical protein
MHEKQRSYLSWEEVSVAVEFADQVEQFGK